MATLSKTNIRVWAEEHGLKFEDSKKPLLLDLTAADIGNGKKASPSSCAFANCIRRQLPKVNNAWFFRSVAYLQQGKKLTRYMMPQAMTREIVSFDRGGSMEPGLYRMPPVAKKDTLAVKAKYDRKRYHERGERGESGERKGKGPKVIHHTTGIRAFQGLEV